MVALVLALGLLACSDAGTLSTDSATGSTDSVTPTDSVPATDSSPPTDSVPATDSGVLANPTLDLVLLPDTQIYVESDAHAAHFSAQTAWVVAERETLGLDFVSQLGDIVSHGGQDTTSPGNADEWARADAAMQLLDNAGMPWGTAVGNHELDQVDVLGSGYTAWASRFGPATTGRFDGADWFGGHSTDELNSWQTARAGGVDFLFLHLELDIPDTAIAWAEGVMSAHPGWPTIVATHSHRGPLGTPYLGGDGRNSREEVRAELLGPNPQIFLLLNGHHGVEEHGEVYNDDCQPVLEMSLDYASRDEGGMGWLGLLSVDPAAGTLTRTTYSPVLDAWETDADSAFDLRWDWAERFSGEPAGTGQADQGTVIDDYSADSSADYLLSDSYSTGGSFSVQGGELLLHSAPNNTVAAVLTTAGERLSVGERWGVSNPTWANVMFMASTVPYQPGTTGEHGVRFRRDSDGLRVESYTDGVSSLGGFSADPGGAITLWIERTDATTLVFSVSSDACGGRTEVDTLTLDALADTPELFVGLQAWSLYGGDARFDDLRVVSPE